MDYMEKTHPFVECFQSYVLLVGEDSIPRSLQRRDVYLTWVFQEAGVSQ